MHYTTVVRGAYENKGNEQVGEEMEQPYVHATGIYKVDDTQAVGSWYMLKQ